MYLYIYQNTKTFPGCTHGIWLVSLCGSFTWNTIAICRLWNFALQLSHQNMSPWRRQLSHPGDGSADTTALRPTTVQCMSTKKQKNKCIYIYIYGYREHTYIYIYMYVYTNIYIYIYISSHFCPSLYP